MLFGSGLPAPGQKKKVATLETWLHDHNMKIGMKNQTKNSLKKWKKKLNSQNADYLDFGLKCLIV